MNLQEQISRIKEMMKLNESNFFNRRIDLDRVQELIKRFAREVYYDAESYEQFRYELVLRAVEYIMWVDYKMGWYELPEQEEIEFNNSLANMYEPLINDLYKKIVEIDKENNMNLQEQIRKVLREETSLQKNLMELFKNLGIKAATTAVGGLDNLVKILNLDLDDIKTQEMLVKNFIYHSKLEGINILHLEINTNKPDKVRIKIHFDTNVYASNVESWVTRTMSEKINKFFPFKSAPYWEPVFASRGVTIILDSEQIVSEDDEDEMNLQETELTERCWKGYTQKGMKTMFGKRYPNCAKKTKK